MSEKKYINGLYIKSVKTQYGQLLNVSINVANFTRQLAELEETKGYINITLAERKEADQFGNTHYAFLNEYKKKEEDPITVDDIVGDSPDGDLPF